MKRSVALLREQWNSLCYQVTSPVKTELVRPVRLKDDDLEAVIAGRRDPENREFCAHLPLLIAEVKSEIQEDMMRYADNPHVRERRASEDAADTNLDIVEDRYKRLYKQDTGHMHRILFGGEIANNLLSAELRIRPKARTPHMHYDMDGVGYNAVYVVRVGAAETQYISGKDQLNAPKATQKLIAASMADDPDFNRAEDREARRAMAEEARRELRAQKILAPLPLGGVYLLRTGRPENMGTLHCSSPLPPDTYAAFLRAVGIIPEGNFILRDMARKNRFSSLLVKLMR